MITTSSFAKRAKHPDAVAISQGVPRWYKGRRYMPLAPPTALLKAKDPKLFDREYRKQMESLDPRQVAEELGPNAILLCWESFNVRCHRRLVAEWLEEKLGIIVPEFGHERAESIPFREQPSKWDPKPGRKTGAGRVRYLAPSQPEPDPKEWEFRKVSKKGSRVYVRHSAPD